MKLKIILMTFIVAIMDFQEKVCQFLLILAAMIQDAGLKIIRENTSENLIFSEKFDIIYIE